MSLPGPLANETNNIPIMCSNGANAFVSEHKARLIDMTGDGILDYVTSTNSATGWAIFVGTGTGFSAAIPISAGFVLGVSSDSCISTVTSMTAGVRDIDGDGRPELMNPQHQLFAITGSDGLAGAPSAGRLVGIDNGFGARTNIYYRSIKGDTSSTHQVPFAEIVIDSVDTSTVAGFGSGLAATRYAYGGAELVFDPAHDRFIFPGYRRTITLQTPEAQPTGFGAFIVSDNYAPLSAVDLYGIAGGATVDAAQRYALFRRIGRPRDVTVLSGNIGTAALADPSQLLGIDVASDARRIAGAHYEWSARRLTSASDLPGPEACTEAVFPYDYAASTTFAAGHDPFDPCIAHGFAFSSSVESWRGDPGAAPPSTANVETRSDVLSIDDFGRVLTVKSSNDVHRDDDDLCIDTVFAVPTGSNERVLSAVSSRTVSDCSSTVYAREMFEYDQLAAGSVSVGHVTSHSVERRDDAGTLMKTIHQFDTTWNASGSLQSVTSTREDGASRKLTIDAYDPFELAVVHLTVTATGVPDTTMTIDRHPLTLDAVSTTDPNGTKRGAHFDGFDRQTMSTITPPGGAEGALSFVQYSGFADTGGGLPPQRSILQKVLATAVTPSSSAAQAAGRTSTVFLDALGRAYKTQFDLGADYSGKMMVSQRVFDTLGRVVFEADPFPSIQDFATAYGTTQFFNPDGTLLCSVRGNGRQTSIPGTVDANNVIHPATDESNELYPTCVQRTFQSNTAVVTLRDASSYLAGSPQQGVANTSYLSATGRVITRSTWGNDQTLLEHATLAYDRLGRLTQMTRYQDASGATKPVTSSWHYDSLGQLLTLEEPDSVPRSNTYSDWGELLDSYRVPPPPPTSSDPPPEGPLGSPPATPQPDQVGLHLLATYDALGRVVHREEQRDGVVDPATVNEYHYDDGVNITPQVTQTYTLGRLTEASWPTGSVSLSYDAAGDVNALVFLDTWGRTYIEKRTFNDDRTLQAIDLFPPDAPGSQEEVLYHYDSAGRGDSVVYKTGDNLQNSQTLYSASQIDPFGRVREAQYGATSYTANYADVGRRLLSQVAVASMAGSRQIAFQGFDPMGRERSRTETKNDAETSTTTYTYDALGRLSSAVKTAGTTTAFNQQFTYDPLGNLLSQTDTSGAPGATNTTLTYLDGDHDRDRICRISYGTDSGTACNVTYDEVGAITAMPTPNGTRQFDYFLDSSIRTIQDDHATAHFRYDAFGEVQELDVVMGAPPFVADVRRDRNYGDIFTWHDETTGSQTVPVLLRKIPGPDGFLAMRHGAGGPWVFSFGEARGTRFLTDEGGAFVQDVNYQPFGKPISTGAQPGNPLYSNQQWNYGDYLAAFGISKLGARLYDPAIGRFLSRDPLFVPRSAATTNPYFFAANDPVNRSDPSGLQYDTSGGICRDGDGNDCDVPTGPSSDDESKDDRIDGCPSCTGWGPAGWDYGWPHPPRTTGGDGSSSGTGGRGGRGGGSGGSGGSSGRPSSASPVLTGIDPWVPSPQPVHIIGGFGAFPIFSDTHFPSSNLIDDAIESLIDGITDTIADASARIANGIFDLQGAQHPSHAEAVAEFRPTIYTGVAFTIRVGLALLLWALGPEAEAPSSRALGKALERAGFARSAGSAAHHIVAGRARIAGPAREVLERFGIGINDAENGVFLPENLNAPNPTGGAVHATLHNGRYYRTVNSMLDQATSREEVLDLLRSIRQSLLSGGL